MDAIKIMQDARDAAFRDCTISSSQSVTASIILQHAMWHVMHPDLTQRPNDCDESSVSETRYAEVQS